MVVSQAVGISSGGGWLRTVCAADGESGGGQLHWSAHSSIHRRRKRKQRRLAAPVAEVV